MNDLQLIENDFYAPGKWFVSDGLVKRHVLTSESLKGSELEGINPTKVTEDVFKGLPISSPVGRSFDRRPSRLLRSSLQMREELTGDLIGEGVEFGAGSSPLAVPLDARTRFSDFYSHEDLVSHMYKGQELENIVKPDFQVTFEDVLELPVSNLDFIIGCHVIEHVANPIKAIVDSLSILKKGGKLILVVPDKRKTFDKTRKLTKPQHLFDDYNNPDPKRDFEHYVDFYTKAMPPEDPSEIPALALEKFEEQFPIHFHTFTHYSFNWLLREVRKKTKVNFDFWTRGPRFTEVDIEFYVSITKN